MPREFRFDEPQRYHVEDHDSDDDAHYNKSKKHGNSRSMRFGSAYAGCILEPVAARVGERESWSLVNSSPMPGNDAQLAKLSRESCQKVGEPIKAFSRLNSDQKGVVLRYIEMQQRQETDKNAIWLLDCVVQRVEKIKVKNAWTNQCKTKHIKVIIRREDRSRLQGGIRPSGNSGHFAIIDLAERLPRAKEKKKGNKKNKFDYETVEEPHMVPFFEEPHDPFAKLGQEQQVFMPIPPPQQPFSHNQHPSPAAIPVGGYPQPQYNGQANLFEPHPPFHTPDLYENDQFQVPVQPDPMSQPRRSTPIEEHRDARSYSRERRQEAREHRRMLEEDERRRHEEDARLEQEEERRQQRIDRERTQRKLEELNGNMLDQQDQMQMLTGKFAELGHSGRRSGGTRYSASSDGSLYRDNFDKSDMWSVHSGASFTPPSSPGRASPILPSGTLGRAHSKRYRDGGRPERRDSYFRRDNQAVLEPYVNAQNSRDRVPYRHVSRRNSYGAGNGAGYEADDYPRPPDAPMPPSEPLKRHRHPQIHQHQHHQQQRAQVVDGNDAYTLPALPEFSSQEFADFGTRRSGSRRRGRDGGNARRNDRQYAYAGDGRNRRGPADRGFYM